LKHGILHTQQVHPYAQVSVMPPNIGVHTFWNLNKVCAVSQHSKQGYASMEYKITGFRENDLVKLEIKINGEPADALSVITHRDNSYKMGRQLVSKLKELIPRQMFKWVCLPYAVCFPYVKRLLLASGVFEAFPFPLVQSTMVYEL